VYGSKGVSFIGVFAQSSDDQIRKFAETYRITFPVGRDNGLARLLGARGIPVTVFLDRHGRIVKRHIGSITFTELSSTIGEIVR
jgi:hypothetical protein